MLTVKIIKIRCVGDVSAYDIYIYIESFILKEIKISTIYPKIFISVAFYCVSLWLVTARLYVYLLGSLQQHCVNNTNSTVLVELS